MNFDSRAGLLAYLSEFEIRTDVPVAVSARSYDECVNRAIQELSDHPSVIGIYLGGSVSTPGISDLDFFIVLRSDPDGLGDLKKRIHRLETEYPNIHTDFTVLPKPVFERTPLFIPQFDPDHLAGQRLELQTPDSQVAREMLLYDHIFNNWYNILLKFILPRQGLFMSNGSKATTVFQRGRELINILSSLQFGYSLPSDDRLCIDIGLLLRRIKKLQYDIELFEETFNMASRVERNTVEDLVERRTNFFENPPRDRELVELVLEALDVQHRLLLEIAEQQTLYHTISGSYELRNNFPILATEGWSDLTLLDILNMVFRARTRGAVLPAEFAIHHDLFCTNKVKFYSAPPEYSLRAEVKNLASSRNDSIEMMMDYVDDHNVIDYPMWNFEISDRRLRPYFDYRNEKVLKHWETASVRMTDTG
jgi:hypothetical protein